MIKTATFVYKFLHSDSPSYFGPSLSLSSCSYRNGHSNPDCQYLAVLPFHFSLSLYKSVKYFGHRFGMIFLMLYTMQQLSPPSGKAQNLPVYKSLSAIASMSPLCLLSMTWLLLLDLCLFTLVLFSCALESVN